MYRRIRQDASNIPESAFEFHFSLLEYINSTRAVAGMMFLGRLTTSGRTGTRRKES